MNTICLQVQPNRARDIDMHRVRELCEFAASSEKYVSKFAVFEDKEKGSYINFMFETTKLQKTWNLLQDMLFKDEKLGLVLSQASIVVCEGKDGWNDYLLLHHYDPTEKLDNIRAR
jgi:hypothetical protein